METKDEYLPFCLQTIDLKLYAIARQREVQSTLGLKSVATSAIYYCTTFGRDAMVLQHPAGVISSQGAKPRGMK